MGREALETTGENTALSWDQRSWRWRILFATYTAYVGYYLTRKVFTIAMKTIGTEFHWDLQKLAHIWTAYLVAYMLGQFINSFVGRKYGPRVLLLGGLGLSILFNIVFGFSNSYATFLVFMFFNGLVQASGWAGSVGGVAHWLRQHERGTIMGVWSTSYLVGNMLVKALCGFLLGGHWQCSIFGYTLFSFGGWRWAFFGCTLISFVIWWIIYFWQRTKPQDVGLEPIIGELEETGTSVDASTEDRVSLAEYLHVVLNPIILSMGLAYFCIKFMRYSLDLWLPAFLQIQGFSDEKASYYSMIFDVAGFAGVLLAGWALDRFFKGQWAKLCFVMGIGMIVGYLAVIQYGTTPAALAIWFGLVGFMLYGPDTLLCGAASIDVAGSNNAVAVAGVVNGIGSIGPIVQTELIGWLLGGTDPVIVQAGMRTANFLTLGISIAFTVLMGLLAWHLSRKRRRETA